MSVSLDKFPAVRRNALGGLSLGVPQSGYTPCACRDCSDIAQPALCSDCAAAGCVAIAPYNEPVQFCTTYECQRDDAYGDDIGDAGTGHGAYEYYSGA